MYPKDIPVWYDERIAAIGYQHVCFQGIPIVGYSGELGHREAMKHLAEFEPIDLTEQLRNV